MLSHRVGARLPRLIGAGQAEPMVGALALEGLAATQAGARGGVRPRPVNVAPEPVRLARVRHR